MPLQYDPTKIKHSTPSGGEILTEQEHKDSCDINKMILNLERGHEVRGSKSQASYGFDDTTMDSVQFRIEKERLERDLESTASEHEFSEAELNAIPDRVKRRFKFRQKQAAPDVASNDDDKTTTKKATNAASKKEMKPDPTETP